MGILKIDKEQEGVGIYNNDFLLDQQELQILKITMTMPQTKNNGSQTLCLIYA